MKAPCHECTRRTVIPNCHATCEQYLLYAKYRQKIRDARQRESKATTALIDGARKIRSEMYRKSKG